MTTAIAANRIARVAETLKLILPDDAREHCKFFSLPILL